MNVPGFQLIGKRIFEALCEKLTYSKRGILIIMGMKVLKKLIMKGIKDFRYYFIIT